MNEPPKYKVFDLIGLKGTHLKTIKVFKKLDNELQVLFQVEKVINPIVIQVTLTRPWRIYNIIHINCLELY
jgi:hypothetical protein